MRRIWARWSSPARFGAIDDQVPRRPRLVPPVARRSCSGRATHGEGAEGGPLLVADSKVVYSPARGLRLLERGVLAMMGLVDDVPRDWRSAWRLLDSEAAARLDHLPWHRDYDSALPHAADRDDVLDGGRAAARGAGGARASNW